MNAELTFPDKGWSLKPVKSDEVPRLVADIIMRPREREDPITKELFHRAIDVLCRVEDARRDAVEKLNESTRLHNMKVAKLADYYSERTVREAE